MGHSARWGMKVLQAPNPYRGLLLFQVLRGLTGLYFTNHSFWINETLTQPHDS